MSHGYQTENSMTTGVIEPQASKDPNNRVLWELVAT